MLLSSSSLSWVYFPTALTLGALHALEPGHAKTLTASYLIGIKGTWRDAIILGLSVAITHSFTVILISLIGLWVGQATLTGTLTHWLQIGSGLIVVAVGIWMLIKRLGYLRHARLPDDHVHDDHHCEGHSHDIPNYVKKGERPNIAQIIVFGAAGGLIPCPASITVMLLALSIGKVGAGLFAVAGFSIGLAITLGGLGVIIVSGINRIQITTGRFQWLSSHSPILSAIMVIFSGSFAVLVALL